VRGAVLTLVVAAGLGASVAGELLRSRMYEAKRTTQRSTDAGFTMRDGEMLGNAGSSVAVFTFRAADYNLEPGDLLLRVDDGDLRTELYIANAKDDAGRREITVMDDSAFVIRSSDGGTWRRCGK
jgi:hypothetical protein